MQLLWYVTFFSIFSHLATVLGDNVPLSSFLVKKRMSSIKLFSLSLKFSFDLRFQARNIQVLFGFKNWLKELVIEYMHESVSFFHETLQNVTERDWKSEKKLESSFLSTTMYYKVQAGGKPRNLILDVWQNWPVWRHFWHLVRPHFL